MRNEEADKLDKLERTVDKLNQDFTELKKEVAQVRGELCSWFDRMEPIVKNLELARVKLEEQMLMRSTLERLIQEELRESKAFRSKVFMAIIGGAVSLFVYIVKSYSSF